MFKIEHCNSPGLQIKPLGEMKYSIFNILVKTYEGLAHNYLSCLALFFPL